jgi:hypothetical protein
MCRGKYTMRSHAIIAWVLLLQAGDWLELWLYMTFDCVTDESNNANWLWFHAKNLFCKLLRYSQRNIFEAFDDEFWSRFAMFFVISTRYLQQLNNVFYVSVVLYFIPYLIIKSKCNIVDHNNLIWSMHLLKAVIIYLDWQTLQNTDRQCCCDLSKPYISSQILMGNLLLG